jgi:hypothetical protein
VYLTKKYHHNLRMGLNQIFFGSHDTRSPPDFPTELTTQIIHSGRKEYMKSLAFSSTTSVSCRKIMSRIVFESSLRREVVLRGPPTPLIFKRKEYHDLALARAFMPLSAPRSVLVDSCCAEKVELVPTFLQALLVLIEENSYPKTS